MNIYCRRTVYSSKGPFKIFYPRMIRMEMSVSNRILGYLAVKRVASYRELKDNLREDRKKVSGIMFYLCKIRKLRRLPFSTRDGKIVYFPKTPMSEVWKYCYDNDLVPQTTAVFLKEIAKKGVVSTIELYDRGLDIVDVRFFIDAFTRQWKFLKIRKVNGFNIFYKDEDALEAYIKENMDKLQDLQRKEFGRRSREGKNFEDVIEKFYQDRGFKTSRNLWFSTESQEKLEIDIMAKKNLFDNEKDRPIIIVVQCKSWRNGDHLYNMTEFLNYYCKLKKVFPAAMFHIWSYNYSKYFFNPSFLQRFPEVTFYWSRHIREAFKVSNLNAPQNNNTHSRAM